MYKKNILDEQFDLFKKTAKRLSLLENEYNEEELNDLNIKHQRWLNVLNHNKDKQFIRLLVLSKDIKEYDYDIINNLKENRMYGEKLYTVSMEDYKKELGSLKQVSFWIFDEKRAISVIPVGKFTDHKELSEDKLYLELFNKLIKKAERLL